MQRKLSILARSTIFSLLFIQPAYADFIVYNTSYPSPLDGRTKIMAEPAGNDFIFEMRKLVPTASFAFTAVEDDEYDHYRNDFVPKDLTARKNFLSKQLTPGQIDSIDTIKNAASDDAAYESGKALPPALRAYMAGAVDFIHAEYPQALKRFTEAAATPDDQHIYTVWANFMVGRTAVKLGDITSARNAFIRTRELVQKGAADPMGLAVASYGEEARLALDLAGGVLGENTFDATKPERAKWFHVAIGLYALQAQAGSLNGLNSLHILAKDIKNVPTDYTLMMQDELARRLFLFYVRGYKGPTGGVEERKTFINALLPLFPVDDKEVADTLAAAAAENDNPTLANHYLSQTQSVLAIWVKAKLLPPQGKLDELAAVYDALAVQREKEKGAPSIDPANIMPEHERAIVTLARGHFIQALGEFINVDEHSGDIVYTALRVLTPDELRQFVDASTAAAADAKGVTINPSDSATDKKIIPAFTLIMLQDELAKRLMRLGKYHEALPYFSKDAHSWAAEYVAQSDIAATTHDPVDKAQALYRISKVVFEHGYELFGGELIELVNPDANISHDMFASAAELDRVKASREETSLPPSFRRMATSSVVAAADNVPPHSQAFAALLCHANNWMRPVDEKLSLEYYHRYVREGAVVSWATHFGEHCPEPDFVMARYPYLMEFYVRLKMVLHRHPRAILVLSLVLLTGLLGRNLYRRKRRAAQR